MNKEELKQILLKLDMPMAVQACEDNRAQGIILSNRAFGTTLHDLTALGAFIKYGFECGKTEFRIVGPDFKPESK